MPFPAPVPIRGMQRPPQCPNTCGRGGHYLQPYPVPMDQEPEDEAEAGYQFISKAGGRHHLRVLRPCIAVQHMRQQKAGGDCRYRASEDSPGPAANAPEKQNDAKGEKEMRLDGTKHQGRSGKPGAVRLEIEKQGESEQQQQPDLAGEQTGKRRRKDVPDEMQASARTALHDPDEANGESQGGQQQKGPADRRGPRSQKAEWNGEKKCVGRIAHKERVGSCESGVLFPAQNSRPIIRISVIEELLPRSPVGDEVAVRGTGTGHGEGENEDRQKQEQRSNELAGHGLTLCITRPRDGWEIYHGPEVCMSLE